MSTRKLVVWPHEPYLIDDGVTIVQIENPLYLWQLLRSLQGEEILEYALSQDGKTLSDKDVVYLGDISTITDWQKFYATQILPLLHNHIDSIDMEELFELDRKLHNKVEEIIFNNDLPLILDDSWDVLALLKYLKISLEPPQTTSCSRIINSIVDVASKLDDSRLYIATNMLSFLSEDDMQTLAYEAKHKGVSVLIIDHGPSREIIPQSEGIRKYYIDEDFIEFTDNKH